MPLLLPLVARWLWLLVVVVALGGDWFALSVDVSSRSLRASPRPIDSVGDGEADLG